MIDACKQANVKLMIAYRQQYEPMNRAILTMRRAGKLGSLKSYIATNGQDQGDPTQWRQSLELAGGGCLPNVGIYGLDHLALCVQNNLQPHTPGEEGLQDQRITDAIYES